MLHRTEVCARRRLSAAMPPPGLVEFDDDTAIMYRVCGHCARGEQQRLWDLFDARMEEANG